MFATVIPLRRMPPSLSTLTYSIPPHLDKVIATGQLVMIPLGQKQEVGLIKEVISKKPENFLKSIAVKDIKEITNPCPIITQSQLSFLEELSALYHTPLGFLIKSNIFSPQKTKLKKFSTLESSPPYLPTHLQFSQAVFFYKNEQEKINYFLKHFHLDRQNLIIVPEILSAHKLLPLFPKNLEQKIAIITSETSPKELFSLWLKIWSRQIPIVVGTRRIFFLPWSNIGQIFVDDEVNPNHKNWDMAPRFHNRDAALLLAKHHQAFVHLISHTPSTETYYQNQIKENDQKLTSFSPPFYPTTIIVDLNQERKMKNFSLLSERAAEEIVQTIQKKNNVFLFLNRRGNSKYILCQDCNFIFKCSICYTYLTYYKQENLLKCHGCGKNQPMSSLCPNCQGAKIKTYGEGTEALESLVKKITKNIAVHVVRLDSDNTIVKKIFTTPSSPYIIIGTQLAWERLIWKELQLAVFINADTPLYIPEYKLTEQLWYYIRDAEYRLNHLAKLIIQTSQPAHVIFQNLSSPDRFYLSELTHRKKYHYPPFGYILKLLYGNSSIAEVAFETQKLYTDLNKLTKYKTAITILNPLDTNPPYYNRKFWKTIIIKIHTENPLKEALDLLKIVPFIWKVDFNPSTLLTPH